MGATQEACLCCNFKTFLYFQHSRKIYFNIYRSANVFFFLFFFKSTFINLHPEIAHSICYTFTNLSIHTQTEEQTTFDTHLKIIVLRYNLVHIVHLFRSQAVTGTQEFTESEILSQILDPYWVTSSQSGVRFF